uniref:Uncharacterized protein n=1 Tax=Prolemur simus TaxID=1328070 RepID=A0A8C8YRD1_PROSS
MKLAAVLAPLCAASLLILTCVCVLDCDICLAVEKDINLFLTGTTEEYVDYVARYQPDPFVLQNGEELKKCVDGKLSEEDKQNVLTGLVSLAVCLHPCAAWCSFSSPP